MSRQSSGLVEGGNVVKFTAAGTVTIDQSYHGKTVVLGKSTGGQHFKLPPPTMGFKVKFVSAVDLATSNSTVSAYSTSGALANIIAGGIASPGVGDYTVTTEVDVITFVAAVADTGDFVELECDGTLWYVHGGMGVSNGVTLA